MKTSPRRQVTPSKALVFCRTDQIRFRTHEHKHASFPSFSFFFSPVFLRIHDRKHLERCTFLSLACSVRSPRSLPVPHALPSTVQTICHQTVKRIHFIALTLTLILSEEDSESDSPAQEEQSAETDNVDDSDDSEKGPKKSTEKIIA